MRETKLHFEQVPIEFVKKAAGTEFWGPTRSSTPCAVCGERVWFESSKTDERGLAVHESCYVATLRQERQKFIGRLR